MAHSKAAMNGQTAVPESAEDEVDFHYVCFTNSGKEGHMYLLDGGRKGPVDTGVVLSQDDDLLSEKSLTTVRQFMRRSDEEGLNFSLMALIEQ
jgi:ubiquitin carboxyl-terminal hydrolase L3